MYSDNIFQTRYNSYDTLVLPSSEIPHHIVTVMSFMETIFHGSVIKVVCVEACSF
jgi:hypothetical protein